MKKFGNFITECQELNEFAGGGPATERRTAPATKGANAIRKFNRTAPAQQFLKNVKPSALAKNLAPGTKGFKPGSPGTMIASVLGSYGADQLGSYLGNKLAKGVVTATGNQQLYPQMFDKQGPNLGTDIVKGIKQREALKPKVDPVVKPKIKPVKPGDTPVKEPTPETSPEQQPEVKPKTKTKPGAIAALATGALGAASTRLSPRTQTQGEKQKPNGNNKKTTTGGGGDDNEKKKRRRPRLRIPKVSTNSSSDSGSSGLGGVTGITPYNSQIS